MLSAKAKNVRPLVMVDIEVLHKAGTDDLRAVEQ
jgi:hypothetical protein